MFITSFSVFITSFSVFKKYILNVKSVFKNKIKLMPLSHTIVRC